MNRLLSIEKRIDCDYNISWPVKLNNGETSLSSCQLTLEVMNPKGERTVLPHTLTTNGIEASFPASIQKYLGEYTLILTVVLADSKTVIDKYAGIILVPYDIIADPTEAENLVSSTITVPSGNIAIGIKGKAFTYADFTPAQIAELQKPATDAAKNVQTAIDACTTATASANTATASANTAASNATSVAQTGSALNTTLSANEQERVSAENRRIASESTRVSNEITRQNNETQRRSAEVTRSNAETQRQNNETIRQSNESSRINADRARETRLTTLENKTTYLNRESLERDVNTDANVGVYLERHEVKIGYNEHGNDIACIEILNDGLINIQPSSDNKVFVDGDMQVDGDVTFTARFNAAEVLIDGNNVATDLTTLKNRTQKISVASNRTQIQGSATVTQNLNVGNNILVNGKYVGKQVVTIGVDDWEDVYRSYDEGFDIIAKAEDDDTDIYTMVGKYENTLYFVQYAVGDMVYGASLSESGWTTYDFPFFTSNEKAKTTTLESKTTALETKTTGITRSNNKTLVDNVDVSALASKINNLVVIDNEEV